MSLPLAVNIDLMLPYKTEAEPWPSIKTTRQIAPPGCCTEWRLWQQLHLFPLTHFIIRQLCPDSAKWAAMTGENTELIILRKLTDTLSKWSHSEVCLCLPIPDLKLVHNDSDWPLHSNCGPSAFQARAPSIVNHFASVTRSNQLQAQYLTLIFITQPTNKFRLHKPQYKADFMTLNPISPSESEWCQELQM